jgi:hypothetical protein
MTGIGPFTVSRKEAGAKSGFALVVAAAPAYAELTPTDVLVAGRTIGFVEKFAGGEVRVGIVVSPDSTQSTQEGNDLKAIFGSQLRVGDDVLKPVMLRTDQVGDADVGLFSLTGGIGAAANKVAIASKGPKIPYITFDLAQVRNGACTIGAQSQPKIEVFVNRKAAVESNTVFSSVFRLMITEY